MRFGIFMELQYPRPWTTEGEQALFQNAVEQIELADELGIDYVWEVEHHFLEEYSHSSAPEIVLAAAARNTRRIRLGHGIVAMPPPYSHPARVAERIATLDLISNGRVEFGTGETASRSELEGYGVPLGEKRDMWLEATEQTANMLALDPYPGYEGRYFSMPCRNVIPKAVQKPHPPIWMACSNREAVRLAGRIGVGVLCFSFLPPGEVGGWIDDYYDALKSECVPIGHTVNANFAIAEPLMLDRDSDAAYERALPHRLFFSTGVAHYYVAGVHTPGRTDLWRHFEGARERLAAESPRKRPSMIGSPDEAREAVRLLREAGADQVMLGAQAGRITHEEICSSLRLFAEEVMPEFQAEEEQRAAAKQAELAPYIEAALRRKEWMQPLADDAIPSFEPFERKVAEAGRAGREELEPDSFQAISKDLIERAGVVPGDEPARD